MASVVYQNKYVEFIFTFFNFMIFFTPTTLLFGHDYLLVFYLYQKLKKNTKLIKLRYRSILHGYKKVNLKFLILI